MSINSRDMVSLVPNPDDLLNLTVEEQARLILKLLAGHDNPKNSAGHSNFFNRGNDYAQPPKYGNRQSAVDVALLGAWSWLENNGHIAKAPSSGGDNWVFVTPAGKGLASQDDASAYRKAGLLPKTQLHPAIADKAYAAFLRGNYDTAIFDAFREVEIAVRDKSGLSQEFGGALMRAAFAPAENGRPAGPLTDVSLLVGEQRALGHLFAGAFGVYRNSTGHRHVFTDPVEVVEVVMFASQLMRIVERITSSSGAVKP